MFLELCLGSASPEKAESFAITYKLDICALYQVCEWVSDVGVSATLMIAMCVHTCDRASCSLPLFQLAGQKKLASKKYNQALVLFDMAKVCLLLSHFPCG